jgi:hypothetical protein
MSTVLCKKIFGASKRPEFGNFPKYNPEASGTAKTARVDQEAPDNVKLLPPVDRKRQLQLLSKLHHAS